MIASLRRLGVNAPEPRNISGQGDVEGVGPEGDTRKSSYSHRRFWVLHRVQAFLAINARHSVPILVIDSSRIAVTGLSYELLAEGICGLSYLWLYSETCLESQLRRILVSKKE